MLKQGDVLIGQEANYPRQHLTTQILYQIGRDTSADLVPARGVGKGEEFLTKSLDISYSVIVNCNTIGQ